jgi:hypothetical protein
LGPQLDDPTAIIFYFPEVFAYPSFNVSPFVSLLSPDGGMAIVFIGTGNISNVCGEATGNYGGYLTGLRVFCGNREHRRPIDSPLIRLSLSILNEKGINEDDE